MTGTGLAEAVESSRKNEKNATDSDENPSKNVHQDERCHLEGDCCFSCMEWCPWRLGDHGSPFMGWCLVGLTSILFTMSKFSWVASAPSSTQTTGQIVCRQKCVWYVISCECRHETYPVCRIIQSNQVFEVIAMSNWYTDLDPFVRLERHAYRRWISASTVPLVLTCSWLNIEECDVLLWVRIHTIDGFRKRLMCVEEMWRRHDDWDPLGALQVQQSINAGFKFGIFVLTVRHVPCILLWFILFGALLHLWIWSTSWCDVMIPLDSSRSCLGWSSQTLLALGCTGTL